jgi:hypothetical protein
MGLVLTFFNSLAMITIVIHQKCFLFLANMPAVYPDQLSVPQLDEAAGFLEPGRVDEDK